MPPGVTEVRHTTPGGERTTLRPGPGGSIVVGPIATSGVHTLSWEGPPGAQDTTANGRSVRLIAASMQDSVESQLASVEKLDLSRADVRATAASDRSGEESTPLWPLLVALGLLIVMLEWYMYNRKVRI